MRRNVTFLTLLLSLFYFSALGQQGAMVASNCDWAGGWVWDGGSNNRLTVSVYVDGNLVDSAPADQFNGYLCPGNIGDGGHGFIVYMKDCWKNGQAHTVTFRVGSYTIPGGSISLNCPGNGQGCGTATPPPTTPPPATPPPTTPPPTTGTVDLTNISGYVGINTLNNGGAKADNEVYRLAVKGRILAEEIRVRTNWADFVFDPAFKLSSLPAVESYILRNGHLPGIPSAAEVQQHGVDLGNAQTLLLQKIEEITLHLIRQQKQIDRLERRYRPKGRTLKR